MTRSKPDASPIRWNKLIIDGTIRQGADQVPCLLNFAEAQSAAERKEEAMAVGRYHRQEIFYPIGLEGQKKLQQSRVCIIGIGALGTSIANNLARAGVGYLRLIDRDIVELTNLQRQVLFTETDAEDMMPKAEAAKIHLSEINSEIEIEAMVVDVNPYNIEKLISGVDLVVDGLDNLETRYLINEACQKNNIRWVYGGAVGSGGMVMNILPGEGPCLHCLLGPVPEDGTYDTCDTVGVISPITNIVAAYESAEAMKILVDSESVLHQLIAMDAWDSYTDFVEVDIDPDCPVCGKHQYSMLEHKQKNYTASLCGHDAYQITPGDDGAFDYDAVVAALEAEGDVTRNKFFTIFKNDEADFKLFPDGRAIINGVQSGEMAQEIFAKYIDR